MRRWISWDRPLIRPASLSREVRVLVERGSIEYSAVTQPLPCPRRKAGTRSSSEAAQRTRVLPTSIRAEPSAYLWNPGVMVVGLASSQRLPSPLTNVMASYGPWVSSQLHSHPTQTSIHEP